MEEDIGITAGAIWRALPNAHSNRLFNDPRRAHEYLALASVLMRLLEIATVNRTHRHTNMTALILHARQMEHLGYPQNPTLDLGHFPSMHRQAWTEKPLQAAVRIAPT